jgi:endonuclease/exonuclease/phosphatase family metal-dependent hydrolase
LIAILPAIVFLIVYVPQLIPKPQTAGDFSVATYNITGWLDTPEKIQLVRALDADILGIEEAYDPVRLREQLADLYPYGFTQVQDNTNEIRYEHFALFSRYPIDEQSVTYIGENQSVTRPIAMRVVVDIDGQPVSVYVAHGVRPDVNPLSFNNELRHNGILSLVEAVRADPNPVIVLCDCNMSEWTTDYNLMSAVLTDSWRERGAGFGLSVPATRTRAPFPLMRSDYIWHSGDFTAPAVKLWDDSANSEHFPMRAELDFRQR